jgi:hypothetical protein
MSYTHTVVAISRGDRPKVEHDKLGLLVRISDHANLRWWNDEKDAALAWLEDAAAQLRQAFTTADLAEAVPGDVIRFGRPGCDMSPWYEIAAIERESLFGDHPDEYSVTLAGYGSLIIPNDWVVEVKS